MLNCLKPCVKMPHYYHLLLVLNADSFVFPDRVVVISDPPHTHIVLPPFKNGSKKYLFGFGPSNMLGGAGGLEFSGPGS